jgi:hypothetical protein
MDVSNDVLFERAVFTLEDLTATDGTVIPRSSILYVRGVARANGRVTHLHLWEIEVNQTTARTVVVPVESMESAWVWNQSDGKAQVIPPQLLRRCKQLCIAAFDASDEETKRTRLLSLYNTLQLGIGREDDLDNPIIRYARDKWLAVIRLAGG